MDLLALVLALIALYLVSRVQRDVDALRRSLTIVHPPPPLESPRRPASEAPPVPVEADRLAPQPLPPPAPARLSSAAAPGSREVADGNPELLERRIGERLLLYAGMLVLVLGVAFFLRYSFERDWMSPAVRVVLGAASGGVLVAAGRRLARRGFRQYGLFLSGGGLAVLFLSVYAAYAFYELIGALPTFAFLAAIAAATAALADREASLPLALMAVCGGFATPFLVGGGEDAQVALFSYDALLIAATTYLAFRQRWPWLNLASLSFTVVTVAAWAGQYYTDTGFQFLRTELFLTLYCGMFVAILRANRRSLDPRARVVSLVLWCAPLLYHGASVALLFPHGVALLVYLILVSVAVAVASLEAGSAALRVTGWALVTLPQLIWIAFHHDATWVTAAVISSAGVWIIFFATQVRVLLRDEAAHGPDVALAHACGMGAFAGLYIALDGATSPGRIAAVALGFALANAGIWMALRRTAAAAVHWLGVACVFVVIATLVGFEGRWVETMLAAEAVVMVWLGTSIGRVSFRRAGIVLFIVSAVVWLKVAVPPGATLVIGFSAPAIAGAVIIACLYVAGWQLRPDARGLDRAVAGERAFVLVAASVLTVVLVSMEIDSYWAVRRESTVDADLARQLMLSASWAAYAGLLIAVGMRYHYPPVRYFAIALFALTLVKVFLYDVQSLAGIYRVLAFLLVGGILLLVSFLYQRSRSDAVPGQTVPPGEPDR
ncbi:MAG TPA: DUF2339 domain-containing protein [Vicinamibacterales bacterium]|nr:DUF2339 domain-containing protein [Vicinamibacterales bacterium]